MTAAGRIQQRAWPDLGTRTRARKRFAVPAGAARRAAEPTLTPAALGFAMPAEWGRHEATWLSWPHNSHDWPGKIEAVRSVYGEIARKIAPGERVRLLVNHKTDEERARSVLARAGADLGRIEFIRHPTNRGWTRDTGPIFVRRGAKGETAIVHFHFNAWAKHDDWQRDRRVPETAARQLGQRLFHAQWQGRDFSTG